MNFNVELLLLPVTVDLQDKLNELAISNKKLNDSTTSLVFNFRDQSYSPISGGWHPVEIRLVKESDLWRFDYVTDFSYQGQGDYAELAKEVDFNFGDGTAQFLFVGVVPISDMSVSDFYQVWECNFLSYLDMGCFSEIEIQAS